MSIALIETPESARCLHGSHIPYYFGPASAEYMSAIRANLAGATLRVQFKCNCTITIDPGQFARQTIVHFDRPAEKNVLSLLVVSKL